MRRSTSTCCRPAMSVSGGVPAHAPLDLDALAELVAIATVVAELEPPPLDLDALKAHLGAHRGIPVERPNPLVCPTRFEDEEQELEIAELAQVGDRNGEPHGHKRTFHGRRYRRCNFHAIAFNRRKCADPQVWRIPFAFDAI